MKNKKTIRNRIAQKTADRKNARLRRRSCFRAQAQPVATPKEPEARPEEILEQVIEKTVDRALSIPEKEKD